VRRLRWDGSRVHEFAAREANLVALWPFDKRTYTAHTFIDLHRSTACGLIDSIHARTHACVCARAHTQVDCKSVSTLSLPQTLDLIKGPEGSAVDLLLVAHKEDEEKLVRLTRKNMDVSNSGGSDGDKGETHGHTNGQPTATGIERQGSNGPAQSVFVTYERSKSVVTVEAPQSPIQSSPPSKGSQKRSLFSRLFNFGANGKSLEKKSGTKKDWSGSTGKMARQDGGATTREKATPGTGNLGDGGEAEQWEKLGIVTKPIISRSNNEMIRHTVSEIEAGGAAAHGGIIRCVLDSLLACCDACSTRKEHSREYMVLTRITCMHVKQA
jgi:hypothetical protein